MARTTPPRRSTNSTNSTIAQLASDMMNPRPMRIACHMVLTSLTLYVDDVLLRTNNSVADAMMPILGTSVAHFLRRLNHPSIKPFSMRFRELSSREWTGDLESTRLFTRGYALGSIQIGAFGRLCKPRASICSRVSPAK